MRSLTLPLGFCLAVYAQPDRYPPAQQFPRFLLYTLDGKPFTDAELAPAERGRIVIFFDPYCDHCQKQAELLKAGLSQLRGIQIIWVSTETAEAIRNFQEKYFSGVPNSYFLRDRDFKFDNFFGYSVAPTIYVYDKSGKLRHIHREEVPVATLLKGL
ncbi:MAG: TlpA family protein disulfide reductase [Bacteroidia bacterium]|nr:TlpA family protein disulfide reductase [Bacteroidia bacterium]MDW8089161.1 TlpA disulfide reductase family protein [Bacteroidia bacterium]